MAVQDLKWGAGQVQWRLRLGSSRGEGERSGGGFGSPGLPAGSGLSRAAVPLGRSLRAADPGRRLGAERKEERKDEVLL